MTGSKSPQATEIECFQDKEGMWIMDIKSDLPQEPIKVLDSFGQLPVWVSHAPTTKKPAIYEKVFSGLPITGEYLYYLACNFKKDKEGWLDVNTSPVNDKKIYFEVYTSFEDDVLATVKYEREEQQEWADEKENSVNFTENFKAGTLGDAESFFSNPDYKKNIDCEGTVFRTSIKEFTSPDIDGWGRMTFFLHPLTQKFGVRLSFRQLRKPQDKAEFERYLYILAVADDPEMKINSLYNHFETLVLRYANMPYVPVSGATRI